MGAVGMKEPAVMLQKVVICRSCFGPETMDVLGMRGDPMDVLGMKMSDLLLRHVVICRSCSGPELMDVLGMKTPTLVLL